MESLWVFLLLANSGMRFASDGLQSQETAKDEFSSIVLE